MKSDIIYLDQEGYEEYLKKIEKLKYKLDEIGKDKITKMTQKQTEEFINNIKKGRMIYYGKKDN
jgi:hypothetical protein